MKKLSITIVNKAPFSIAASRLVGNMQECLDFIPGTTIRGALARIWLNDNGPDSNFKEIFASDKVIFSNLYIKDAKPIPLSAFSCKYYSGFRGDQDRHGVVDILLSTIRASEDGIAIAKEFQECSYRKDASKRPCSAPMKKFGGYYLKDISANSLSTARAAKRVIYHTAISHVSETALEGALYSQEVIEEGQRFRGNIWVDDDLFTKIENFIRDHKVFYLGSDKSIGLGRFEMLSYQIASDNFDKEKLRKRIGQFNQRLGLNNGKTYFSITFQSDAIITDKFMRYKTFIEPDDLCIQESEPTLGIAESTLVQGWNAMTRLPKEDVISIEKGSVFVFSIDELESVLDRLYQIECVGIGQRSSEGFGRLTVCDPFHFEEGLK